MNKILLTLSIALGSVLISTSAFAAASGPGNTVTLEDVQTRLAPYIPQGRAIREMSGMTTYGGGASCSSSISIKPDEIEIFATWGDSGASVRFSPDDKITMIEQGNQLKISILKEGLPNSVTLSFKGQNIESLLIEETYKTLFFKRQFSLLCSEQTSFIPNNLWETGAR